MQLSHHRPTVRTTQRARREGGYIMAMFGLLLVPLLLMAGLAVDVGSWYNRSSDIQKAADAAALAGVVWLPDVAKARSVALEVAKKNGFDNAHPDIVVTANPSTRAPRRLNVVIQDLRVGSYFYSNVGGGDIDLKRGSYAEYVTPVPMGSPRNFFGLGTLDGTGFDKEFLYQSVNPYCTSKANGDRHQTPFDTGRATSHDVSSAACNAAVTPATYPDYRPNGYELYIDAPVGRTSPIEIRLYDARYSFDDISWQVPDGQDCPASAYVWNAAYFGPETSTSNVTISGPMQYQTRNNGSTNTYNAVVELLPGQTFTRARNLIRYRSPDYTYPSQTTTGWTGPSTSTTVLNINGPVQWQQRANSTTTTWTPTVPNQIATGGTPVSLRGDRLRYRSPTYTPSVCTPRTRTVTDSAVDSSLNNNTNTETYTYTVLGADDTPLDDTDNPVICNRTFTRTDPFDTYEYLGSRRWNTMPISASNSAPCLIGTAATSGKYILRVRNNGSRGADADGSNQYGVVARYTNAPEPGLCDGRSNAMCPRVYGKDAISVRAAATTSQASFFLAEIGPEHAGKKLKIELWDPGEGGSLLKIQQPSPGPATGAWSDARFDWRSTGAGSGTGVTSINVTGSVFNARLVEITVDLTGYNPPANNRWWKIYYEFNDPNNRTVSDRTTWSARIVGDPVHLLEEN